MTPPDGCPSAELPLLAVDLETTGLSPHRDRVLAIGWVPVNGGRIELAGARRVLVGHDDPGPAVAIHGLTHDDLVQGLPLHQALRLLDDALAGRALLAHHAPMEVGFLRAAYRRLGEPLPAVLRSGPVVCTLRLERRLLHRAHSELPAGALRLWRARARHGLPPVRSHDALGDALAAAELYLAQLAELEADGRAVTLRDLRLREGWWRRLLPGPR
ncbi:3'-5' exonuclease [Nocardioides ferulae]|uniref:3'-5' exonuclease n=1 Tax=Nocardioides ferulae TaxID=2340821 RepID=UPI000EAC8080|nr:3'-5' exonuclease [Nocardioides ferulae]